MGMSKDMKIRDKLKILDDYTRETKLEGLHSTDEMFPHILTLVRVWSTMYEVQGIRTYLRYV